MKFTDRFLQSVKSPEKEYCIREGHGFTLRVLPSGVKTFQFIYTLNGKRRRMKLGQYPAVSLAEAREKFREAALLVGKGKDPNERISVAAEAESPLTISRLVDQYKKFAEQHLAPSTSQEISRTLFYAGHTGYGNTTSSVNKSPIYKTYKYLPKRGPSYMAVMLNVTDDPDGFPFTPHSLFPFYPV